jgi:DNA-binding CsgD family transcriptional regulator
MQKTINSLNTLNSAASFGLCLRDKDFFVLYQNVIAKKICGTKKGKCLGCRLSEKRHLSIRQRVKIDRIVCHVIQLKSGLQYTSILNPILEIDLALQQEIKSKLTPGEYRLLDHFFEGLSKKELAQKMFLSLSTIKTHLNNIYKKIPILKSTFYS